MKRVLSVARGAGAAAFVTGVTVEFFLFDGKR